MDIFNTIVEGKSIMNMNILLVGDYNRSDFLYIAKHFHKEIKFYFIEHLNKNELLNKECFEYGEVLFWKDFAGAYELLDKIKPDKILFYFIESYNHVALNVAAKMKRISTYHLEHGLRFPLTFFKTFTNSSEKKKSHILNHFKKVIQLSTLNDKIKNRRFFIKTIAQSESKAASFLNEYFKIRSKHSILETWQILQDPLRLPDSYISYSPFVFKFHKELDRLPENYAVHFTGIPILIIFLSGKV